MADKDVDLEALKKLLVYVREAKHQAEYGTAYTLHSIEATLMSQISTLEDN